MSLAINKDYLKDQQYKSSSNLDARIAIHKFNTSHESFYSWIWRKLEINKPVSVLDIGCGTGSFWAENLPHLPAESKLLLTDFSEGMVEKARKKISGTHVEFQVADIENLKYSDNSYDIVMAHHVIYHAGDKDKALSELKRVVKDDGVVSITTNSEKHMLNVYDIGRNLDNNFPTDRIIDSFTEEIADKMLENKFKQVIKHVSEDLLKVTDLEIMIGYVKSGVEPRNIKLADDFYDRYSEIVKKDIKEKGYFAIAKRSPLYICKIC